MMVLKYLERDEIDNHRWDQAIEHAENGLPYAYTWYLDCVAQKKWGALISEDYQYIMPLPWNKKWFAYRQVYQPPFTQQLGIFGRTNPSQEITNFFLQALPYHSRYTAVNLNEANAILDHKAVAKWRTNMIMSLDRSYDEIRKGYSGSLRRRVNRVKGKLSCEVNQLSSYLVVNMYREHLNYKIGLSVSDFKVIQKLIDEALLRDKGVIYSAQYNSETIASIFFLKSHDRLIQLFGSATLTGKQLDATHYLIDNVIEDNCGHALLFDFEGSELPGVANFFRRFGPQEVKYAHVVLDHFPIWLKALKSIVK